MNAKLVSRLQDALDAAQHIRLWLQEDSFEELANNIKTEVAYVQRFERIGEALRVVRDIDLEVAEGIQGLHGWISLRHRLIHDYREIDLELLWNSATDDIPVLILDLERVIRENS